MPTIPARVVTLPSTPGLQAVYFADLEHGWAAGHGVILHTPDGGSSWTRQFSGTASITGLHFATHQVGWAWGDDVLLGTRDGGRTWVSFSLPASPLRNVEFLDASAGWLVAGGTTKDVRGFPHPLSDAKLFSTDDGGRTWAPRPTPTDVQSVCFANGRDGWIGTGNRVWRTANGGASWSLAFTASVVGSGWLASVHCSGPAAWAMLAADDMAAGHQPYVLFRTLDGASWAPVVEERYSASRYPQVGAPQGPGSVPGEFQVLSSSSVIAAQGFYGTTVFGRTTDGGQTWRNAGAIPSAMGGGISFVDADHGWLAVTLAGHGAILATDNGGATWRQIYPKTALFPARSLAFVSDQQGYGLGTLGDPDAILRTNDGGVSWQRIANLSRAAKSAASVPYGQSLVFTDPRQGWAVTWAGTLSATVDGGITWRDVPVPEAKLGLAGVSFTDDRHGCVQSRDNQLYATTDGGHTWRPAGDTGQSDVATCAAVLLHPEWSRNLPERGLLDVMGSGSAWTFDASDNLLATSDGGRTWTKYSWPAGGDWNIWSVSFADREHGWLLTASDRLFQTEDGGATWTQLH